ncbi:MAG: hypothetical protein ACK49N_11040 [Verrucomicrobiota bacterium]
MIRLGITKHRQKLIKILEVGTLSALPNAINSLYCGQLLCCRCNKKLVHGLPILGHEIFDRTMKGLFSLLQDAQP